MAISRTRVERITGRALFTSAWMWVCTGSAAVVALFLFVGSLQLMKTGAANLDVLSNGGILVRNPGSTLGLGWLGALLVLSGSPIAASSLTLVSSNAVTEMQGYTMLVGSRLGAAFVVLFVGVIYALRGGRGRRRQPLSTAVIALCLTILIYAPGALIGWALLGTGVMERFTFGAPPELGSMLDLLYGPIVTRAAEAPSALVFGAGLLMLLGSFKLIDRVLKEPDASAIEARSGRRESRWWMFAMGCGVALLTMSVSVALTLLVPLGAKGHIRRDQIGPYIIGANITTLGDTLLAALVLDSTSAVGIVLACLFGVALTAIVVLALFHNPMQRLVLTMESHITKSRLRLASFTAALFAVPLAVIGLSTIAG